MAYTWEEVMMGIDVRKEAIEKEEAARDIAAEQEKERKAMAGWGLVGSILGAITPLGPVGYFLGKQAGKIGADLAHDWESDIEDIETGKFHTGDVEKYKERERKRAKDQYEGQWLDAATDLASMYIMGGGFAEGPTDLTTFGGGKDQWTVLGRGPEKLIEGAGTVGVKSVINPDRIPSLIDIYGKEGIKGIGKTLGSAYTSSFAPGGVGDLANKWLYAEEGDDVSPKGKTFGRFAS